MESPANTNTPISSAAHAANIILGRRWRKFFLLFALPSPADDLEPGVSSPRILLSSCIDFSFVPIRKTGFFTEPHCVTDILRHFSLRAKLSASDPKDICPEKFQEIFFFNIMRDRHSESGSFTKPGTGGPWCISS
jgi:hypothetical protein